jgi:hypothetical protein
MRFAIKNHRTRKFRTEYELQALAPNGDVIRSVWKTFTDFDTLRMEVEKRGISVGKTMPAKTRLRR